MKKEKPIINLIEYKVQKFIEEIRPPEDIREQLDIGYTFQDNILIIHEIRPRWNKPSEKINPHVARAKFIKSRAVWIIYWKLANGKWEIYKPNPEVKDISEFLAIIKADQHHCFWG